MKRLKAHATRTTLVRRTASEEHAQTVTIAAVLTAHVVGTAEDVVTVATVVPATAEHAVEVTGDVAGVRATILLAAATVTADASNAAIGMSVHVKTESFGVVVMTAPEVIVPTIAEAAADAVPDRKAPGVSAVAMTVHAETVMVSVVAVATIVPPIAERDLAAETLNGVSSETTVVLIAVMTDVARGVHLVNAPASAVMIVVKMVSVHVSIATIGVMAAPVVMERDADSIVRIVATPDLPEIGTTVASNAVKIGMMTVVTSSRASRVPPSRKATMLAHCRSA